MTKKPTVKKVEDDPRDHDPWQLLKKYRDVVWSLELSVQQLKKQFELEYGSSIEDFLESVYLSGADLGWMQIENHARCIERSQKMLSLLDRSVRQPNRVVAIFVCMVALSLGFLCNNLHDLSHHTAPLAAIHLWSQSILDSKYPY